MTADEMSAKVNAPRVLLVDDDPDFVTAAAVHLAGRGYTVVSTWNCDQALKLLEAGPYDAILLDNGLPGRMGIVALPQLVAAARVPVVLISAHPSEDLAEDARLLGAKAFIPKPPDWGALAAKLKELIEPA